MPHALTSKLTETSSWLALVLGATVAALLAQSCSVDTSQYTFSDAGASSIGSGGDLANTAGAATTGGNSGRAGASPSGGAAGTSTGGDAGSSSAGTSSAGEPNMSGGAGPAGCTIGEQTCSADGHLQTCVGDPPSFDAGTVCGVNKCSASLGACLKCAPGEFQCLSNVLQQCNIFGARFEDAAICDSNAACVASGQKGYCVRCKAGVSNCEATSVHVLGSADDSAAYPSTRLSTCNLEGSATDTSQTCLADAPICDSASKQCLSCEPNALFCDGSSLNQCSVDGQSYTNKSYCQSGTVCDAAAGKCVLAMGCSPGTFQCVGATLQSCRQGRFENFDECSSAALCDANFGRCQKCSPSVSQCVADAVQQCDSNWGEATPYTRQQCAVGNCSQSAQASGCNACRPGTIQCFEGSQSFSLCTASGTYGPQQQCPKDAQGVQTVCSSVLGQCAQCVPGRATCDPAGVLKVCNGDGAGFTTQNCQDTNQQCDAGRAKCIDAQPGRYYCTAKGDLMRVEYDTLLKNHALVSTLVESCGSLNQCNQYEGTCRPKHCVVGQSTCGGADVYSCDTGERRQRSGVRCGSAARCQDGYGCVKVLSIAAGDAHTCAVVAGSTAAEGEPGYILCWGANESGQLGNGSALLSDSKEPRQVLVGPSNAPGGAPALPRLVNYFTSVSAGKNFSCADLSIAEADGGPRVACWGSNAMGQLGTAFADPGPFNGPFAPVTDNVVLDKGLDLHGVSCGAEFACALGPDGTAWCWGSNEFGQLGNGAVGTSANAATPIVGFAFTTITAGARHACGVKPDNSVWCWGEGTSGQLGTGGSKGLGAPTLVGMVSAAADRPLALGNDFTLAMTTRGAKNPSAWGANRFGQLGNGTLLDALAPTPLTGLLTTDFGNTGRIYTGSTSEHACARLGDRLVCWGANVFGEVGDGTTEDRPSPVQIWDGKTDATKLAPGDHSVALGGRHTCALSAKGDVMCWGANHRYQLGNASLTPQRAPLRSY